MDEKLKAAIQALKEQLESHGVKFRLITRLFVINETVSDLNMRGANTTFVVRGATFLAPNGIAIEPNAIRGILEM